MRRTLTSAAILISVLIADAQNIEVDGFKYSLIGNGQLKVIGGPNTKKVTIPEDVEFRGKIFHPVIIGKSSFATSSINEIVLPSSIIEIEDNAFSRASIKTINFPNNLRRIGKYAFEETMLDSIFLPRSLAYNPHLASTGVDQFAFKNCKSLRVVEFDCEDLPSKYASGLNDPMIKEDMESIRVYYGAFDFCDNIEKVICNSKRPHFELGWDQNYNSQTFPTIVLELATLYCPAEDVEQNVKWFDSVKPISSTIELYEQKKKNKGIRDKLKPLAAKHYSNLWSNGQVGTTLINHQYHFYVGQEGLFIKDPKIKDLSINDDKVSIKLKKNEVPVECKFIYRISKVTNLDPDVWNNSDSVNIIDVISTEDFAILLFRSREEGDREHYWLFSNDKLYIIDPKYYSSLKFYFESIGEV